MSENITRAGESERISLPIRSLESYSSPKRFESVGTRSRLEQGFSTNIGSFIDADQMTHFRQIIEEEKMYKYKESYKPPFEVLDGWGWSFRARFSDGSSIYSHGFNAGPKDNGLARIRGYMEELVQDGVQVEFLEEE